MDQISLISTLVAGGGRDVVVCRRISLGVFEEALIDSAINIGGQ